MNNIIFFNLYGLAHRSIFLDWVIVFCANNFGYIMIFLAVMFLIFHTDGVFDYRTPFLQLKNKLKEIGLVFSSAIAAYIFQYLLKLVIPSPRPFLFFDNVVPLFLLGGMDSFPSGHAMFFGALAMSLYFIHKRIGTLYFIVALIVGLARVAGGVHFPVDIFIGYILGILIAIIFERIFIKNKK
jgi:undecaprenyl-diphosphatase